MKLLLYVLLITAMIFISFKQEQNNKKIFKQLNALQGTWRMETSRGTLYESWIKTNDTLMRSNSYKLKEKDTILLEQVSLQHTKKGIFYILEYMIVFHLESVVENKLFVLDLKMS